jgi:hypothetical protein
VSAVECRGDGAALDPNNLCDLSVIEIGVVAEKQNESLPLGERSNCGTYLGPVIHMPIHLPLAGPVEPINGAALLRKAHVHQRSP